MGMLLQAEDLAELRALVLEETRRARVKLGSAIFLTLRTWGALRAELARAEGLLLAAAPPAALVLPALQGRRRVRRA